MTSGSLKLRSYWVWEPEEEEALRLGVARHGAGSWQAILQDPGCSVLQGRTGIQLKDKWRNLVKSKGGERSAQHRAAAEPRARGGKRALQPARSSAAAKAPRAEGAGRAATPDSAETEERSARTGGRGWAAADAGARVSLAKAHLLPREGSASEAATSDATDNTCEHDLRSTETSAKPRRRALPVPEAGDLSRDGGSAALSLAREAHGVQAQANRHLEAALHAAGRGVPGARAWVRSAARVAELAAERAWAAAGMLWAAAEPDDGAAAPDELDEEAAEALHALQSGVFLAADAPRREDDHLRLPLAERDRWVAAVEAAASGRRR
uniref:Uncharacterized protein n=1 Tax=Tetraselmis sp. GSL018 TaxID=582737 RepID=A0A061RT19_9CHLO|mmetsp:Transcript_17842/g.42812  ORF Transcript_17842/g.42812 Transcript_17842/m.42812 type:complete len:324 (+) Transcript_17842:239-1210(+)